MKKKWICFLLSVSVGIVTLGGCGATGTGTEKGEGQEEENMGDMDDKEKEEVASAGNTSEDGSQEINEETSRFEIPEIVIEPYEIPDNEALAFTADMKIGWNLGNTFDAYTDGSLDDELDSETLWVSTTTTKDMIDDIKAAGFNTMRLPVTWHSHLTDDSYTISEAWLDRVQ